MNNYKIVKNEDWKEVEVNGEIVEMPSSWKRDSLNELCDVRDGTHESPKFYENGIPFITTKNLVNGQLDFSTAKKISLKDHEEFSKRSKVDEGDILTGMIGTIGNPVLIRNKKTDFSIKNIGLIKSKNKLDQLYVFYSFSDHLKSKQSKQDGGVIKFMTLGDLRGIQLKYPPLEQQSAIATILSKQEQIISNLETLIKKLELRFQYMSDELLSGRIRAKEENGKTILYKNTEWKEVEVNGEMTEIPSDWEVGIFTKYLNFQNGTAFRPSEWKEGGTPIIRIQNLSNKKAPINYAENNKIKVVKIKQNDVLFAWSGTIDIFHYEGIEAYLNQHIFKVTAKKEDNFKYLIYCLKDNILKMNTNGLGMQHVTLKELDSFNFFFCPNIMEQKIISSILDAQKQKIKVIKNYYQKESHKFIWLSEILLSGKYVLENNKSLT